MRFIVVGDIMVDHTVYGEVRKISPEAPIPVIERKRETYVLGGAANVARNIVALGHEVIMNGHVSMISTKLFDSEPSIDIECTVYKPMDNIKLRYVDIKTGYQLLRADNEDEIKSYGPVPIDPIIECLHKNHNIKGIILSDYDKGAINSNSKLLIQEAKARGIPIFVDTRRANVEMFKGVNWIMPNLNELDSMLNSHGHSNERDLVINLDLDGLIVTLSEDGMYCVDEAGSSETIKATQKDVVDVTGAGDTALATFAVEIALGESSWRAMEKANENAGLVCLKRGTATI